MIDIDNFKDLLGETGKNMTNDEIIKLVSVLDQFADYWLDKCETKIFGKPVKDLVAM